MNEATVLTTDDLIAALEAYRRDTGTQAELPMVAQAALRTYLHERGYLPAAGRLHITPDPEGSGTTDISTVHDRELAGT